MPLLLSLCWLGLGLGAAHAAPPARPNVILIVADDLGYGELGCYGQTKIKTPHLDKMATEGLRFTRHYAGNNVCAPSRCCLLTGKHPGHALIRDNREAQGEGQFPLPADAAALPRLLQAAGYSAACVGKWGLGGPGSSGAPLRQGFDFFFGYNCQRQAHSYFPNYLWRNDGSIPLDGRTYSHDLLEAEALRFLDAAGKQPFFLFLPFSLPHLALQIPDAELAPYRGLWEDPPYEGKKGYQPHPTPRAAYAAMITRLDKTVGKLLAKLKEKKLDQSTLTLFTSDNGPTHDVGGADTVFFNSAGPLRGRKGSMFEGGLRVPLIARWPGQIKPGYISDLPSANWDFLPTLAELAGAAPPEGIDGVSLVPTLLGQGQQKAHDYLYWESPGYGGAQAIFVKGWKGIRRNLAKGEARLELFDLTNDEGETQDLAAKRPDVAAKLAALMDQAHHPNADFPLPGERRQP